MQYWLIGILSIFHFYSLLANVNPSGFYFNQLSVDERLPGTNVFCIFQDQKGIMWFGIEGIGLCKYNGRSFQVYSKDLEDSLSISDNFPLCITEDSTGILWIGTSQGLNGFDRQNHTFKKYYFADSANSIPGSYITALHIDRYNNLWIATRTGLSKFIIDQNKFYNILVGEGSYTDGLPAIISDIYEDKSGNIWIGSYSSGLFLIDSATNFNHTAGNAELNVTKHWFPIINETGHDANYAVQKICEYDDQSLLLGKIDGLYLFNRNTESYSRYRNKANTSADYNTISALLQDPSGKIWAGYATRGLLLIDQKGQQQHFFNADIYVANGIGSNAIRDLYLDKSGLIWIATKFHGIYTYDNRQEMLVKHSYNKWITNKVGKKFILCVFEDSKNNIWIGTKNSGVIKACPKEQKIFNYTSDHQSGNYFICSDRVESVTEDIRGNIWAGTRNGCQKLSSNGKYFVAYDDYYIRCMVPDKYGNLWLGTNSSGILYYNANDDNVGRFISSNENSFFIDTTHEIIALNITSDSLLWISTYDKGLYKYNLITDRLRHYENDRDDSTSISSNLVQSVYQDKSSNIWISTKSKGLNKYNFKTDDFSQIKQVNSLPPNSISNILQDWQGNYWMGTNEGIFTIHNKTGEYNLYNTTYGLKSLVTEINACSFTHDGLIIFGGSEGLNIFDPETVLKKSRPSNLVISSVKIYNRTIAEEIGEYAEFPFSYKDKFITIEFALTDYAYPIKIQYKYMLKNFDKDWILSGNTNIATYTDLPPGEYIFKVKATNADQQWTNESLDILLKVNGPIWRNPFIIMLCIVLIVVMAISIHKSRLRFLKKNEIRLNNLVKIKTRDLMDLNQELEENEAMLEEALDKAQESDKLKTAFLANLSHEIRTPMNGILGFAGLLKEENLGIDQFHRYIEIIQKSGMQMLTIINDLIDISKIESGQIKLNKGSLFINNVIDELLDFFKPEAELKGLHLITEKPLTLKDSAIIADRSRLMQVLNNLIKNAIKHTTKGQIAFGYSKNEKEIKFFVRDTGKGIKPEMQEIIFQRFRQAEDTDDEYMEGSGLGLSISKAFVELHGGKIYLESQLGKGSTFYFTIPNITYIVTEPTEANKFKNNKYNSLKGKKVLVAEDDEYSYLYLRELLVKANMKVLCAKNGIEAVELAEKHPDLDLILMDLKMSHMNGLKAARIIKSKQAKIPIVLQSAYALTIDKKKINKESVDDFILKPVQKDELFILIQKHIVSK